MSDKKKPLPKVYDMMDLNQYAVQAVSKYWTLKERVAYTRTCQMVADACRSLWITQKVIKADEDFEINDEGVSSYHKMVLLCPNLKEFNINRCKGLDRFFSPSIEYNRMEFAKILAEKCPKIEKFDTSHSWEVIIAYLKVRKGDNCIKSLKMILDDPDVKEFPKHIDFMAECLNGKLESLKIEAEDWETSDFHKTAAALKLMGAGLTKLDASQRLYKYLAPDEKLESLGPKFRVRKKIPEDFSSRHPNLKKLEGKVKLDTKNLQTLMPMQNLTCVSFEGSRTTKIIFNKEVFNTFLSRHPNLKSLSFFKIQKMDFSDLWIEIGTKCPKLEFFKMKEYYPNREASRKNLFIGLSQMIKLKEIYLDRVDHDGFSQQEVDTLFDTLNQLKKMTYRPSRFDDDYDDFDDDPEAGITFQARARNYLARNPDRKIEIKIWEDEQFDVDDSDDDSDDDEYYDENDEDDSDDSDDDSSDDSDSSFSSSSSSSGIL